MVDIAEIGISVDSSALEQLSISLTNVDKKWVSTVASIVRQQTLIENALKASSAVQIAAMESVTGSLAIKALDDWGKAQRRRLSLMTESEKMAQRQAVAEERLTEELLKQEIQANKAKIANQTAINKNLNVGQNSNSYGSAQASAEAFTQELRKVELQTYKTAQASQIAINKQLSVNSSYKSAEASASAFILVLQKSDAQVQKNNRSNQEFINNQLGIGKSYGSAQASAEAFTTELRKQETQALNTARANQSAINKNFNINQPSATSSGAGFGALDAEVERLAAKFNKVYAASKLYESSLNELNRANQLGVISSNQYNAALDALNLEFSNYQNNAVTGMNRFANAAQQSKTGYSQLGMVFQQTGYQVGDFLVQIQSGQSVLVAFGQQATQLVGVLPMLSTTLGVSTSTLIGLSAGLGIAIPLITAVGAALLRWSGSSKEAEAKIKAYDDAIKKVKDNIIALGIEQDRVRLGLGSAEEAIIQTKINDRLAEQIELRKQIAEETAKINDPLATSEQKLVGMEARVQPLQDILDISLAQNTADEADLATQLKKNEAVDRNARIREGIIRYNDEANKRSTDAIVAGDELVTQRLIDNARFRVGLQIAAINEVFAAQAKAAAATQTIEDATNTRRMALGREYLTAMNQSHAAVLAGLISAEVPFKTTYANFVKDFNKAIADAKEQQAMFRSYSEAPIEMKIQIRAIFDGLPQVVQDWLTGGKPFGVAAVQPKDKPSATDFGVPDAPSGGSSGGGGGGGIQDQLQSELDAIKQSELSKEEVENESYNKRHDTLQAALDRNLISIQDYNALELSIAKDHAEALAQIDVYKNGTALDKAGKFFGDMAAATQAGGARMLKISKVFGAAEALINSYKAFTDVLADKDLKWWMKIPAAVGVLSAGLNMVSAIKGIGEGSSGSAGGHGGGSGGGGRGSPSVSNSAAPQAPQRVLVQGINPDDIFTGQWLSNFFDNFYKENNDRGAVFMVNK